MILDLFYFILQDVCGSLPVVGKTTTYAGNRLLSIFTSIRVWGLQNAYISLQTVAYHSLRWGPLPECEIVQGGAKVVVPMLTAGNLEELGTGL